MDCKLTEEEFLYINRDIEPNRPYIYKITCIENSSEYYLKEYVGKHCGTLNRYFTSGTIPLKIRETFGIMALKKEVIEYTELPLLDEREFYWINRLNTVEAGMNIFYSLKPVKTTSLKERLIKREGIDKGKELYNSYCLERSLASKGKPNTWNKDGVWINNGKYQYISQIKDDLPDGYSYGRIENFVWVNNLLEEYWIDESKLTEYINKGFSLGRSSISSERLRTVSLGKKHMTKNNKVIQVDKTDVAKFLNDGWVLGNNKDLSGEKNPAFGTKLLNNKVINKRVSLNEVDDYLNNGWFLGSIKKQKLVKPPCN